MVTAQFTLGPRGERGGPDVGHGAVRVLYGGVGRAIVALTNPASHEAIVLMMGEVMGWRVNRHAVKMAAIAGCHIGPPLGRVSRLDRSTAPTQAATHAPHVHMRGGAHPNGVLEGETMEDIRDIVLSIGRTGMATSSVYNAGLHPILRIVLVKAIEGGVIGSPIPRYWVDHPGSHSHSARLHWLVESPKTIDLQGPG